MLGCIFLTELRHIKLEQGSGRGLYIEPRISVREPETCSLEKNIQGSNFIFKE